MARFAQKMKFEPFRAYLQQCCNPTLLVFVVVIVVLISQSQLKIAFNCVQDSPEREKMNKHKSISSIKTLPKRVLYKNQCGNGGKYQ